MPVKYHNYYHTRNGGLLGRFCFFAKKSPLLVKCYEIFQSLLSFFYLFVITLLNFLYYFFFFQTPWPQCTRLASLSANNQVLQIAKNGKEILVYSIAKQEEEEEVADLAHEHFYSSSPMREIFLFDYVTKDDFFACTRARLQKCFHPNSNLITVREKSIARLVTSQAIYILEKKVMVVKYRWILKIGPRVGS